MNLEAQFSVEVRQHVLLNRIKGKVFCSRLNWANIRRPSKAFFKRGSITTLIQQLIFQIQKGSIMKRFIAIAAALAAIVICSQGSAQAQTRLHPGGFPFPGGCCQQGLNGIGGLEINRLRREQPPYFAKFPPVYYSHVVKRPYGISPYAAPAGVMPVEMAYAKPVAKPVAINNPFFKNNDDFKPVVEAKVKTDMKVETKAKPKKSKVAGWQANPFFENQFVLN